LTLFYLGWKLDETGNTAHPALAVGGGWQKKNFLSSFGAYNLQFTIAMITFNFSSLLGYY
jgi:hypothetical protein